MWHGGWAVPRVAPSVAKQTQTYGLMLLSSKKSHFDAGHRPPLQRDRRTNTGVFGRFAARPRWRLFCSSHPQGKRRAVVLRTGEVRSESETPGIGPAPRGGRRRPGRHRRRRGVFAPGTQAARRVASTPQRPIVGAGQRGRVGAAVDVVQGTSNAVVQPDVSGDVPAGRSRVLYVRRGAVDPWRTTR